MPSSTFSKYNLLSCQFSCVGFDFCGITGKLNTTNCEPGSFFTMFAGRPRADRDPPGDQPQRRQRYRHARRARWIAPPLPVDTGPPVTARFRRMAFSGYTVGAHIPPTAPVEGALPAHPEPPTPVLEPALASIEAPGSHEPSERGTASIEEFQLAHTTTPSAVESEYQFGFPETDIWDNSLYFDDFHDDDFGYDLWPQ